MAREEKPFDLLANLAKFSKQTGMSLQDPKLLEEYLANARTRLTAALDDAALMHGTRTERLFEATVRSLGRFDLLKSEDNGTVHSPIKTRAPDFRIVLEGGEQWLVEVKNVRKPDISKQSLRMSKAYLSSLERYVAAVGGELRVAVYWSSMSIWTIVSIDRFRVREGGLRIEFSEAMKANEFARLGDVMILTTPPLQLSVLADKSKPRGLAANDTANFTIGDVKIYGAGREISDPIEKQLAYILMFYGEWNIDGPFSIMDESGIAGARFVAHPEEASEDGMDSIAWASRSFGRYYNSQTLDGDLIKQLDGEPADNWFAPLSKWDFQNAKLSLWVFRLQPSSEATSDEASGKVIANLADGAPTRVQ